MHRAIRAAADQQFSTRCSVSAHARLLKEMSAAEPACFDKFSIIQAPSKALSPLRQLTCYTSRASKVGALSSITHKEVDTTDCKKLQLDPVLYAAYQFDPCMHAGSYLLRVSACQHAAGYDLCQPGAGAAADNVLQREQPSGRAMSSLHVAAAKPLSICRSCFDIASDARSLLGTQGTVTTPDQRLLGHRACFIAATADHHRLGAQSWSARR